MAFLRMRETLTSLEIAFPRIIVTATFQTTWTQDAAYMHAYQPAYQSVANTLGIHTHPYNLK